MNPKIISTLLCAAFSCAVLAQDKPSPPRTEQIIKGATGAVVGGVLGSQVGQGDGKTAATAAGAAAGAVVGSGCKPTLGSAIGAAIGGFFGSQIGGDNKNAVAGAGAAVGAMLGSDCEPEKPVQASTVGEQPGVYGAEPVIGGAVGTGGDGGNGGNGGQGGKPAPMIGRVITINGIALTEVAPEEFPMGKFAGFPVVSKKADFVKLDEMTKAYTKASWEAAARKDFEAFTVNRHLAMKLAEFRLHHKISTVGFVDSLSNSNNGTGTLAPGATIFLPGFTRWGKNDLEPVAKAPSAADYMAAILDANIGETNWADAPKTADLGGLLNSVIGAAAGAIKSGGGIGNIGTQKKVGELLGKLPIGAVFSARDVNGNSFLVERTPDGFNLGNTSGRPVQIPLGAFGFVPELPEPDVIRRAAAPFVGRMQEARRKLFWESRSNGRTGLTATIAAPNFVLLGWSEKTPLDSEGNLAANMASAKTGELAYKKSPEYKVAIELSALRMPGGCGGVGDSEYAGEYLEVFRALCLNDARQVVYSQEFYVTRNKKLQTVSSLMRDKATAESLKNADSYKDLAESIIGLVPVAGNIDSAAACASGDTITQMIYNTTSYSGKDYRAFVSDLLPSPRDETVLEKSLSCAGTIPVVGTIARKLSQAGNFVGLYSDWAKSEKAAGVLKAMEFLDTKMFENTVPVYKDFAGVSGQTISAVKNYYDNFQRMRARDAVVDSAMQVMNGS